MRFFSKQWSPEEIANRLALENSPYQLSYNTICMSIYSGVFDPPDLKKHRKGAKRYLGHRGKPRRKNGREDKRGYISISHSIQERPEAAADRQEIGQWERDTVLGKHNGSCLLTITDRCNRYLLAGKLEKKRSEVHDFQFIRNNGRDKKWHCPTQREGQSEAGSYIIAPRFFVI